MSAGDVEAARRTLGVAPGASWDEVRAAYRAAIRRTHPDVTGGPAAAAAALNVAYATLLRARRPGVSPPLGPVEVLDGDTLHLSVPPDEAFRAIVEAADRIGDVTYVDRSCAILETLVDVPGEGVCSLVVTLQGRAHGTDAFCTLEAIEHVGSPPVAPVASALREALAHWDHA